MKIHNGKDDSILHTWSRNIKFLQVLTLRMVCSRHIYNHAGELKFWTQVKNDISWRTMMSRISPILQVYGEEPSTSSSIIGIDQMLEGSHQTSKEIITLYCDFIKIHWDFIKLYLYFNRTSSNITDNASNFWITLKFTMKHIYVRTAYLFPFFQKD